MALGRKRFANMENKLEAWLQIRLQETVLLRTTMVIGVVGTAAIAGFLAVGKRPEYALLVGGLPLFLIGIQLILQHVHLMPELILIAATFVPISFSTGTASRLVLSLLLSLFFVGIWVLRMFTLDERLHLEPSSINRPVLGFIAAVFASLIWSMVFRDPLVVTWASASFTIVQVASGVVMMMLPGALLLVANCINGLKPLKALVVIMLTAGALGLIRQYNLAQIPVNTGGLFTMWIIALSTGQALFNRKLTWISRGLLLALAGAWVFWGFGLHFEWMVGWLPGLVALSVLSFMRSRKIFLVLLTFLIIIIAVNQVYYLAGVSAENQVSGQTRLAAWSVNWRVTSKHLLLGTGPAGYAAYYMYYFPGEAMATHNNYIDILSQTGIIGLGLGLWFFLAVAWKGYKLCLRLRSRGDFLEGLAVAAFAGTVSCVVAMAFGDWLFPFAYTQTIAGYDYAVYNWLFMGTILVADRLTKPKSETLAHA